MTQQEIEQIKGQHLTSYKGIFYSYDCEEIKKSRPFQISIVLAIILIIASVGSKKSTYDLVIFWSSQVLSIFPNLLGFNLGGYALIIGFGNTELVESMTKKDPMKKTSVFQKLSGVFAFAILLQLTAFFLAFIVNYFVQLQFTSKSENIVIFVNLITIFLLSFLGFWGIFFL